VILVLATTAAAFFAGVALPRQFPWAIRGVLQIVVPGLVTDLESATAQSAPTGLKATRQVSIVECDDELANTATLQRQLEEMQNQRDVAIKRAQQAARQISTKGNNQELRNQLEEMQRERLLAVRAAEGAAFDAEKAAGRAMKLASQLKDLQVEHDTLQNTLAEARTREHHLVDCQQTAQDECQKALAKVADLTARLKNMQVECSDARSKADEARAQQHHMTKLRENSLQDAQESAGRASQLAARLKGIEHVHSDLRAQVHEARRKEQEARHQEKESVKAMKDAERKLEILTGQAGASKHRLAFLEEERGSLQAEKDSLQAQLEEERRKGQSKLGSKLAVQLKEQQEDFDRVMKKKDELVASLRRQHDDIVRLKSELRVTVEKLAEERGRTRQLDEEVRDLRRENRVLQRDKRRSASSPRLPGLSDESSEAAAVELFGELLLRKVSNAPSDKQNSLKRQLLLCFHPDRNPATEVATRLTQILNGGGS